MGGLIFSAMFIFAMLFVAAGVVAGGVVAVTALQRTNSAWSLLAIPVGGIGSVVLGLWMLWVLLTSG